MTIGQGNGEGLREGAHGNDDDDDQDDDDNGDDEQDEQDVDSKKLTRRKPSHCEPAERGQKADHDALALH